MGEAETKAEAGLPEEGEAAVAAQEGSDLEVASVVPRFLFFTFLKLFPSLVGISLQVCVRVCMRTVALTQLLLSLY